MAFILTRNFVFVSSAYVAVESFASDTRFSGKNADLQTLAFLRISQMF